jgi:predicted HicB family RNase H-like nuclease
MKDTTISLKIDRVLKAKIVSLAKLENRSLSNYIEKILKAEVAKHESSHSRGKAQS